MEIDNMAELESMVEKNKSTLQKVGYLTSDEMVDVDTLYTNLKEIARRGPVTENIPTIGDVRFTEEDVDKLYRYIK